MEAIAAYTTIGAISGAYRTGSLSAAEFIEAQLDRIARLDPDIGAYQEVYADDARLAAEASDKARASGHRIGPFHGVPFALKDLYDVKGRVTTGGSMSMRHRVSPATGTIVARLIAPGGVLIGKTKTDAFGGWGGRLPMDGIIPLSQTFDTPGTLTRSVADAALLLELMEGRESWRLDDQTANESPTSLAGLRIGAVDAEASGKCEGEVLSAYEEALETLRRAGAAVETFRPPEKIEAYKDGLGLMVLEADQSTLPGYYTSLFNNLGMCALSVPCGLSAAGLPIGLQIAARAGAEATLLEVGAAFEALQPPPAPPL